MRLETYSQGLSCGYLQGEVAYLECAVRFASHLAEVDQESLTLSLVDDAFFVLVRAEHRPHALGPILSTLSPQDVKPLRAGQANLLTSQI